MLVEESITKGPTEVLSHLKLMIESDWWYDAHPMSRQKGKPVPDPQCFQPLKINLHPPASGHPLLWKNIVICVEIQHIAKSVDDCGNSKLDCHADQKLRKELLAEPTSYEIS